MTTAPDLELQGLIVQTLKADADVNALVQGRIFDRVPEKELFPYVSYAGDYEIEADADCIYGSDLFVQLDAWSRQVGFPEVKRICHAVRDALHDKELSLAENAMVLIQCQQIRIVRDPDGLTNHGIVEVNAFVERRP